MSDLKEQLFAKIDEAAYALTASEMAEQLGLPLPFGSAGAGDPIEAALAELVQHGRVRWYGREPDRVYYTNPMQLK